MIIWGISYLVCLMYGVDMSQEVKAFFACLSWLELFSASFLVVFYIVTWLNERVSR